MYTIEHSCFQNSCVMIRITNYLVNCSVLREEESYPLNFSSDLSNVQSEKGEDSSTSKDCGYVAQFLCEQILDCSSWISTFERLFCRTSFANELIASVGTGPRVILTGGFYSCHPLVLVTSITAVAHSVIHP